MLVTYVTDKPENAKKKNTRDGQNTNKSSMKETESNYVRPIQYINQRGYA